MAALLRSSPIDLTPYFLMSRTHSLGVSVISDCVTQTEDVVKSQCVDQFEHGGQRSQILVQVCDNGISHEWSGIRRARKPSSAQSNALFPSEPVDQLNEKRHRIMP